MAKARKRNESGNETRQTLKSVHHQLSAAAEAVSETDERNTLDVQARRIQNDVGGQTRLCQSISYCFRRSTNVTYQSV